MPKQIYLGIVYDYYFIDNDYATFALYSMYN